MKLIQFQAHDPAVRLGAVVGDRVVDLTVQADEHPQLRDMLTLLQGANQALDLARDLAAQLSAADTSLPLSSVHLMAPILRPEKIVAIGLNYRDHCIEVGIAPPTAPVIFAKFPNSITGPYDPIVLPAADIEADYEVELAVVIGRKATRIPASRALDYIAGYMVLNDVSARKWQFADKQWVRGKSCNTFCPTGPWLTTADQIADPHSLRLSTRVNGRLLQDSNTSNLICRIPELIEFITESITLVPGDIIATGTPFGVGFSRKPPVYLQPADVVEVEIEGLGKLRNSVMNLTGQ